MKRISALLTLLTVCSVNSSTAQNFLTNGSFESSTLTPNGGATTNAVLTLEGDGWTSSPEAHIAIGSDAVGDILPSDGARMLIFNQGNQQPAGSIFQTINLTPNLSYRLSFDILNIAGGLNVGNGHFMGFDAVGLRADIIQNSQVTHTLSYYPQIVGQWYTQTIDFNPTESTVTISFADISTVTSSIDVALDNVQLVPEPSTYALLLLSGAASLWALRRRKS